MTAHRSFPKLKRSQTPRLSGSAECPCGSAKIYGACCGIWHAGWNTTPPRH
ncbi:MAG: SEC-C metal-binding domain-containing protein, partial [Brachymonas sp.]